MRLNIKKLQQYFYRTFLQPSFIFFTTIYSKLETTVIS